MQIRTIHGEDIDLAADTIASLKGRYYWKSEYLPRIKPALREKVITACKRVTGVIGEPGYDDAVGPVQESFILSDRPGEMITGC